MGAIELKISEASSISKVHTDVLILKNIPNGVFGPEKEIDEILDGAVSKMNKREFCLPGKVVRLKESTENANCVLLMGMGEIELVDYESIKFSYGQAFRYISDNLPDVESVATVIHGVGFGLEKKNVFIQLVKSLLDVYDNKENLNLNRLIINENGAMGQPEVLSYVKELASIGSTLFFYQENDLYIRTRSKDSTTNADVLETKASSKNSLVKGEIIEAIERLRKLNIKSFDMELDLLESRYNALKADKRSGVIDEGYFDLESNRIRKGILEILDRI